MDKEQITTLKNVLIVLSKAKFSDMSTHDMSKFIGDLQKLVKIVNDFENPISKVKKNVRSK